MQPTEPMQTCQPDLQMRLVNQIYWCTQYHGVGTAPGNYTGSLEVIDPNDDAIIWNAATNLWQVSFNVTGFSGFFVSGVPDPLPVKLVSFNYYIQDKNNILLKWDVAEQVDIRKYVVERSSNGRDYSAIGSVTANSETSYTYQFTDNDPVNGVKLLSITNCGGQRQKL